jgi:AsmA family/AsmA-like C-terminal region
VRRVGLWVAVGVGVVVVLAIAALLAVPFLVDTPRVQGLIASTASQALGRPVKFSAVSVSVLPLPAVVLRNLEVAEDPAFGTEPFLKLNRAEIRLRLWPLLLFRVELGDFVLKQPVITLIQNAEGRWNFASLGAGGETAEARGPARSRTSGGGAGPGAVLPSRIKIEKGVVAYESRAGAGSARYRVEDLDLTITPSLGPIGIEGDASIKPGDLEVKIAEGTVAIDGGRALTEAPVRGRLVLDGRNLQEFVAAAMGPDPVIGGGLKGTLTLGGTVGKPTASGEVLISNLTVTDTNPQCPEPKQRTLTLGPVKLNAAWEDSRFAARPVTTSLANGAITTNLTATLEGGTRVELGDIAIKAVPIEKLLVDFLCQGYAVTGPLNLTGQTSALLSQMWTTLNGAGQLRLGPGKVVGPQALALLNNVVGVAGAVESVLSKEGRVPAIGSALEYDSITATYTITKGVISTKDLTLTGRALSGKGAGTYALANGVMNVDLTLKTGQRELRANVTGTAARPSVRLIGAGNLLTPREKQKLGEELQDLLKRLR